MTTSIIMLFIVVSLATVLLAGCKKGNEKTFFDIDNTSVIRGVFSIVIVLVHIPEGYRNPIQDIVGSFAYIGVTFFFMTSAYGLMLTYMRNPDSIKRFWGKRIVKLLVPMVLVNIVVFILTCVCLKEWDFSALISINRWVRQLVLFYFIYWLVFRFTKSKMTLKVLIVCALIFVYSLLATKFKDVLIFGWPTESLGFVYGLLLATFRDKFVSFASKKWVFKCAVAFVLSLVFGVMYLKFKSVVFVGDYLLKLLLGLGIIFVILLANSKLSFSNFASRFLSGISYEVYLIHSHIFFILSELGFVTNSGVFILVGLVATILFAKFVNMIGKLISTPLLKK